MRTQSSGPLAPRRATPSGSSTSQFDEEAIYGIGLPQASAEALAFVNATVPEALNLIRSAGLETSQDTKPARLQRACQSLRDAGATLIEKYDAAATGLRAQVKILKDEAELLLAAMDRVYAFRQNGASTLSECAVFLTMAQDLYRQSQLIKNLNDRYLVPACSHGLTLSEEQMPRILEISAVMIQRLVDCLETTHRLYLKGRLTPYEKELLRLTDDPQSKESSTVVIHVQRALKSLKIFEYSFQSATEDVASLSMDLSGKADSLAQCGVAFEPGLEHFYSAAARLRHMAGKVVLQTSRKKLVLISMAYDKLNPATQAKILNYVDLEKCHVASMKLFEQDMRFLNKNVVNAVYQRLVGDFQKVADEAHRLAGAEAFAKRDLQTVERQLNREAVLEFQSAAAAALMAKEGGAAMLKFDVGGELDESDLKMVEDILEKYFKPALEAAERAVEIELNSRAPDDTLAAPPATASWVKEWLDKLGPDKAQTTGRKKKKGGKKTQAKSASGASAAAPRWPTETSQEALIKTLRNDYARLVENAPSCQPNIAAAAWLVDTAQGEERCHSKPVSGARIRSLYFKALQILANEFDEATRHRDDFRRTFESLRGADVEEDSDSYSTSTFQEINSRLKENIDTIKINMDQINAEWPQAYTRQVLRHLTDRLDFQVYLDMRRNCPDVKLSLEKTVDKKLCVGSTVPRDVRGNIKEDYLDVYEIKFFIKPEEKFEMSLNLHFNGNQPDSPPHNAHFQRKDGHVNGPSTVNKAYIKHVLNNLKAASSANA